MNFTSVIPFSVWPLCLNGYYRLPRKTHKIYSDSSSSNRQSNTHGYCPCAGRVAFWFTTAPTETWTRWRGRSWRHCRTRTRCATPSRRCCGSPATPVLRPVGATKSTTSSTTPCRPTSSTRCSVSVANQPNWCAQSALVFFFIIPIIKQCELKLDQSTSKQNFQLETPLKCCFVHFSGLCFWRLGFFRS